MRVHYETPLGYVGIVPFTPAAWRPVWEGYDYEFVDMLGSGFEEGAGDELIEAWRNGATLEARSVTHEYPSYAEPELALDERIEKARGQKRDEKIEWWAKSYVKRAA